MSYDNFNTWGYGDNVSNSLIVTNDGVNKEEVEKTVSDAIDNLIDGAPEALDTLKELADALDNDTSAVSTITKKISDIDSRLETVENKEDFDDTEIKNKIAEVEKQQENFLNKEDAENLYQPKGDYLTEHQSLDEYAKIVDVNEQIANVETKLDEIEIPSMDNVVKTIDVPTKELPNRKAIALEMGDMLLGGGNNLVMLNRWGVVDLGTSKSPINLNTPKDVRPTVQEAGTNGENAHKIAYTSDFEDYALKSELPDSYDDTEIKNRLSALETKEDKDTIYDDTELRTRIETIEKIDHDTFLTKEEANHDYLKNNSLEGYATEQWVEDKNFLTEHQSLDDYALKSEIPTLPSKVSELENDSEYQTKNEVDERIQNIIGTAPEALDTLGEIATALNGNSDAIEVIKTTLSGKVSKEELSSELSKKQNIGNYISYEDQNGRKVITFNNTDIIGAIANEEDIEGKVEATGWQPLIQLNKWNVVDLGSPRTITNINTIAGQRPTVQEAGTEGKDAKHIAYVEDLDNLVTKDEIDNAVKFDDFGGNRKTIQLKNNDTISGVDTNNIGHNLVMLSKWDVADFGAKDIHFNITSSDRPTIQLGEQTGEEAYHIAFEEEIPSLEDYATKEWVESKNYLIEHQDISNLVTIDEFNSEINKTIQFTTTEYQGRSKKVITLDNDELINARSNSDDLENKVNVNGKTISLIQLNRWNVVDVGSPYTLTNINTPDGVRPTIQEKSQSGTEAHKIAYLSDFENISNIVNSLSANVEMLQMKLEAINKSNIEIIEISNNVIPEMTDISKDYIISGDINTSANISGRSIELSKVSISNNARLKLNANDIEIKDLNLSGDFPKATSNSVIQINNAEFILFKDIVFDSSNVYNGVEIGLSKTATQQAKNIIFDNCQFKGEFTNNAILVFATENNAVITLNNCHFDKVSNAIRISNRTNAKNVIININNCTINGWDNNPEYQGFIIFEDYTNKTEEDVNTNNLFAPEKITVNINNLIYQGKKLVPTDITNVCGTADENQIIYVYSNAMGLISYDVNKYPTINFN